MDEIRFTTLKDLFDRIVDLPPEEREPLLAQIPIGEETRRQLDDLLAADHRVEDMTARRVAPDLPPLSEASAWLGRRIGAFALERELGHGGMGMVFLARRVDGGVDQRVAVKLIRPERLDEHTLARFRVERQVLALLKHPHIAALLDLGELADGTPYVVMEYVEGRPITVFANERSLTLRQRLQLFLDVCDAVANAHQTLVVHRDLKPNNILVTADGRVKLLDFGIAKPLIERLGSVDVSTTGTLQRFFTPSNAAPEQLRGAPAGIACDIYGLGILLYELLTGLPALELQGLTPAQAERVILEQEPQAPSKRLAAAAQAPSSIDARVLRGDLDAIVLYALRKKPEHRYASVEQFAEDIRRFLQARPVKARQGTRFYALSRFAYRRRVALGIGVFLAGALAVFAITVTREKLATQRARSRAENVTDIVLQALRSVDPNHTQGKDITAKEVFEQVAALTIARPDIDPLTRARLLVTLAQIDAQLGVPMDGVALLDRADQTRMGEDQELREDYYRTYAGALLQVDKTEQAGKIIDAGLAAAPPDKRDAWMLLRARYLISRGEEGANGLLTVLIESTDDVRIRMRARRMLGGMLYGAGDRDKGYSQMSALLDEQRQRLPSPHPELVTLEQDLTEMAIEMRKLDVAEALADESQTQVRQLYGERSAVYANTLAQQAGIALLRKDLSRARALQERAVAQFQAAAGEDSPAIGALYFDLAGIVDEQGELARAEEYYDKAMTAGERSMAESSLRLLLFRSLAAYEKMKTRKFADSNAIVRTCEASVAKYPKLGEFDIVLLLHLVKAANDLGQHPNADTRKKYDEALIAGRNDAADESTRKAIEDVARFVSGNLLQKPRS